MEIGLIVGSVFFLIAVFVIVIYLIYEKIRKKKFITVTGKCIEIEKLLDSECPVFQIYWNGHYKNICNRTFVKGIYYILNDEYELLINPNNPDDFYIKKSPDESELNSNSFFLFFGYIVFMITIVILISGLGFNDYIVMLTAVLGVSIIFIYILFKNLQEFNKKKKVCTLNIQAKVVDIKKRIDKDEHINIYYTPIYQIYYKGKNWKITNNNSSKKKPKLGDVINIKINPDNPKQFIDKNWYSTIYWSVGTSFVLLLILICSLIGNLI